MLHVKFSSFSVCRQTQILAILISGSRYGLQGYHHNSYSYAYWLLVGDFSFVHELLKEIPNKKWKKWRSFEIRLWISHCSDKWSFFSYFEQLVVFFDALSARRGCSRARAATSNSPRCMQDAHVLSSSSFSPPLPSSHSFPSTKVLVLCPSQKHSSLLLWFIPVLGTEVEV